MAATVLSGAMREPPICAAGTGTNEPEFDIMRSQSGAHRCRHIKRSSTIVSESGDRCRRGMYTGRHLSGVPNTELVAARMDQWPDQRGRDRLAAGVELADSDVDDTRCEPAPAAVRTHDCAERAHQKDWRTIPRPNAEGRCVCNEHVSLSSNGPSSTRCDSMDVDTVDLCGHDDARANEITLAPFKQRLRDAMRVKISVGSFGCHDSDAPTTNDLIEQVEQIALLQE